MVGWRTLPSLEESGGSAVAEAMIFAREGVFELPSRLRGTRGVIWRALAKKANEFSEVLCGSGKQELVLRAC